MKNLGLLFCLLTIHTLVAQRIIPIHSTVENLPIELIPIHVIVENLPSQYRISPPAEDSFHNTAVQSLRDALTATFSTMVSATENPSNNQAIIYNLRMGVRKSLALLSLYDDFLPQAQDQWLINQLHHLMTAMNPVRDDDVIENLLSQEFSYQFQNFQEGRLNDEHSFIALSEKLEQGNCFTNQMDQLLDPSLWRSGGASKSSLTDLAKEKLAVLLNGIFQTIPNEETPFVELHHFRIRIKGLCDMMQQLESVIPTDVYTATYPELQNIESMIGRIHDLGNLSQKIQAAQLASPDNTAQLEEIVTQDQILYQQARETFFTYFTPELLNNLQAEFHQFVSF